MGCEGPSEFAGAAGGFGDELLVEVVVLENALEHFGEFKNVVGGESEGCVAGD